MAKNLMVITVDESPELTLEEVCRVCGIPADFVQEMIAYGAIEPQSASRDNLRFTSTHLHRIRMITHLHHDLDVNIPGAALVMDMMDEMERMRVQIELFERYMNSR